MGLQVPFPSPSGLETFLGFPLAGQHLSCKHFCRPKLSHMLDFAGLFAFCYCSGAALLAATKAHVQVLQHLFVTHFLQQKNKN